MALGPTQLPIQWVPGALSLGVKWQGREADHSPHLVPRSKNEWSYTSSPTNTPSWRGAQLKHRDNVTFILYFFFSGVGNSALWAANDTVHPFIAAPPCRHDVKRTFHAFGVLGNVKSPTTKSRLTSWPLW
jgi:hypothetical protein